MSNNIPTETNMIAIKQEPDEDTETKSSDSDVKLEIIPIEPKQEEDVISFLTQHQFVINQDVDIVLHSHDYQTKKQDSSLRNNLKQFNSDRNDFISAYKRFLDFHTVKQHASDQHNKCYYTLPKYKFNCRQCNYGSLRDHDLAQHMIIVHNLKHFICHHCGFGAMSKKQLASHVKSHLVSHVKSQHDFTEYKCSQCNYTSMSKDCVRAHFNRSHVLKKFTCVHCDYASRSEGDLVLHLHVVHNLNCDFCGFTATCKEQLVSHMKTLHP